MSPPTTARSSSLAELIELIAPERCAVCGEPPAGSPVAGWCDRCLERVPLWEQGRCGACGAALELHGSCRACRAAGRPWDGMWVAAAHEGPVRELLGRHKYGPDALLARPLGALLVRAAAGELALPAQTPLVPVPQRAEAWHRRGFHPAGELATALARARGGPVWRPLRRARGGPPQVGLTAAERRRNVVRRFRVSGPAGRRLAGRPVLLVDDVVTTTATAAACATALRQAGATSVVVVALARATL